MKVKQKPTKNSDAKILGIKDLKVKLHRLTKADIEKIIHEQSSTINYDFTIKIGSDRPLECSSTNKYKDQQPFIKILNKNSIQIRLRRENEAKEMNKEIEIKESTLRTQENAYVLRSHSQPKPVLLKYDKKRVNTVSCLTHATIKRNLWTECKRKVDDKKLIIGAIVFAKQTGYSPWPCKILSFTKNKTSAKLQYFGYSSLIGSVKCNEIVQMDNETSEDIGKLIHFFLSTKSMREYHEFSKAIGEIRRIINYITLPGKP